MFIGIVTFFVNLSIFHVFYKIFHIDYGAAISIAYVITVLCHFSSHRIFTFNAVDRQLVHHAGKYILMLVFNYMLTMTVVWLAVEVVWVSPYIGVIAATAMTAISSFFVMTYFVFRSGGHRGGRRNGMRGFHRQQSCGSIAGAAVRCHRDGAVNSTT